MKRYIIGITGASGACIATAVIEHLCVSGIEVIVTATPNGLAVFEYEIGESVGAMVSKLADSGGIIRHFSPEDMFASIASGSFRTDGMMIVPCSMGTVGALASGSPRYLLGRAADVTIKEKRPLVIVPREAPLSAIHLRNMATLADAGAVIFPPVPMFYGKPSSVDELVLQIAGRAMSALGIENSLYPEW